METFDQVEILLVEDNPHDAEFMIRAMKEGGFANKLHWVKDGQEAWEFLTRKQAYAKRDDILPRLIFLDLKMPRVGGTELLERIRKNELTKHIPVAAGLGGGSSDAATALRLASGLLGQPLTDAALHELAAHIGADVPYFLRPGPQLGVGDGTELSPVELPQDYWVVLAVPADAGKESTAAVYGAFDERNGARGFETRRALLMEGLGRVRHASDLAHLPVNDLVASPLSEQLRALGAFRADVTGAGPAVYGLFGDRSGADHAAEALRAYGRTLVARPAWYG